jgi:hypothetical protein
MDEVQQTLSSRYALLQFFPIIQYVGTLKGLVWLTEARMLARRLTT